MSIVTVLGDPAVSEDAEALLKKGGGRAPEVFMILRVDDLPPYLGVPDDLFGQVSR
jgi:hypothetical protein